MVNESVGIDRDGPSSEFNPKILRQIASKSSESDRNYLNSP